LTLRPGLYTRAVLSPILAFRPARVAERLGRMSEACALAPTDLVGPAAGLGLPLALVRASAGPVARGALVAAKELLAPLGLALPPGLAPGRWFDVVTGAADEVAAGLPIFLSGEVVVEGEAPNQVEQAREQVWALVDGGVTHVAIDAGQVSAAQRARVLAELAEPTMERGVALDVVVDLAQATGRSSRALFVLGELRRARIVPAIVSVRCPAAPDAEAARAQAGALGRLVEAVGGVPLMRRGPLGDALCAALAGGPLRLVEDGGAAEEAALAALPSGAEAEAPPGAAHRGESRLAHAVEALGGEGVDRIEARAYLETTALLERLGLAGSAPRIARALLRRLERPGQR